MRIPIVNEQDEIISYKERDETTREDIRRISSIWVFNNNKDFLIAKRQKNKTIDPDKWGPSVAGTLEEGETYLSNAIKELEEELGIKNVELKPIGKIFYETSNSRRFSFRYSVTIDLPIESFIIQKSEVSEIKWINIDDLSKWYEKTPDEFVPSFGNGLKELKKHLNENQS